MRRKHKLPLKTALKMGLSVKRPVRFCLTVLLAAVAFAVTGLALLAGFYDETRAKVQSYARFGDSFALYGTEKLTYDVVKETAETLGLPCGALKDRTVALSAETDCDLFAYGAKKRVHATLGADKVGCYAEELFAARGIVLLAGKTELSGNEALLSECFANGLIACGYAEDAAGLIGKEIGLKFRSNGPEEARIAIAGVYRGDDCAYLSFYRNNAQGTPTEQGPCRGIGEPQTGALFVAEELFIGLSGEVTIGYLAGDGSARTGERVVEFFDGNGACVTDIFASVEENREEISSLAKGLGAAGGVLAGFSMLMLFQFVHISVDGKRQVIGILRALGGRSSDVVEIFLVESGFLGLLSAALALALMAGLTPVVNGLFAAVFRVKFVILVPHWAAYALVFAMSAAAALLSAFFPVRKEAKKLPVDVIKFNEE